jgi:molybdate transport system ATP-binding protein
MESPIIEIDISKTMLTSSGEMQLQIQACISSSQLVAIFGASGAGKTTLLRILAGLAAPGRGHIIFRGKTWYDSAKNINLPPQQRNISFMFQDYALFPNMSVLENIMFAQPKKDKEAAHKLLEAFGLEEFCRKKTTGLSGGQRQRVALARALARKPDLLLLDEPLSALDAQMRSGLQSQILRAHSISGGATLMVSHDLGEVFRLAGRVIYIKNGTVSRDGTPDEVFSENSISGKVQITGQVARIEKQDTVNILTVVSGSSQVIKVIAFDSDMQNIALGDSVLVYTKAFNPIISRIEH